MQCVCPAPCRKKTVYYAVRLENGNVLRVSSTQYSILKLVLELVQPVLWILLLMLVLAGVFASRLSKGGGAAE